MRMLAAGLMVALGAYAQQPQIEGAAGSATIPGGSRQEEWASRRLPVYDHIVIVVEENKDYEEIIGNPAAEFINRTLRAEGASLTKMFAEEHHSEGNYFWLLSGSNQNLGFLNDIPQIPFDADNLAQQLIAQKLSFKGFSEDLPETGSTVTSQGLYARKHVPWISFSNVPNGKTADQSANLRFADFPGKFELLPTVSFVIPNLVNDMHDGPLPVSIKNGDQWLSDKLNAYYLWAKSHNSLLVVTFDENDHGRLFGGLTDPIAASPADRNRIVTILAGSHIRHGEYPEGAGVTHVNLLRTLEAMYGLDTCGSQQALALEAGIADGKLISDVFESIN